MIYIYLSQQTPDIQCMLEQCWINVDDVDPALVQHAVKHLNFSTLDTFDFNRLYTKLHYMSNGLTFEILP